MFERCFRDIYQALCFFATGMLHDDVASEDVVQEVFVKMLNMEKSFDSYDHLKHYLYVSVHNLCVDKYKLNQRFVSIEYPSEKLSYADHQQSSVSNWADLGTDQETIEIQMVRAECIRMIASAIEELPEGQRTAFKLAYIEDRSNEEIAVAMGVSVSTVKVHKQRAKENLRKKLKDIYPLVFILAKFIS